MDDPNYPPSAIIAIPVVLPLLTVVAVVLRFYVRLKLSPTYLGIDDWTAAVASLFCLGFGASLIVETKLGVVGHIWPGKVPSDRKHVSNKGDYAIVTLEKPLYGLMKLSALFFFRRIFYPQRTFRIVNTSAIIIIILWSLAYTMAEILVCGAHPESLWNDSDRKSCVNQTWLNFTYAITDTLFDIIVISMPYPALRKLQLGRRAKLGLAAIFLLGTLSTAASLVRLDFISKAFTKNFGASGNKQGAGTPPVVWSLVEGCMGVLAACLPPLGPLIKKANKVTSLPTILSSKASFVREKISVPRKQSWPFEHPPDSAIEMKRHRPSGDHPDLP